MMPDSPTTTIGAMLSRRAVLSGDQLAVVSGDARKTFAQLDARVDRAAAMLQKWGIGKGDRVALLMRNGLAYCELFYAIGRIGGICCALNHRLAAPEIAHILADSGARLLIHDAAFSSIVPSDGTVPGPVQSIALASEGSQSGTYEELLQSGEDKPMLPVVAAGDPLLLVYTSGTTGRPKGAIITHGQLFWASMTIGHTVDFRQGDVHLLPAPMFHVGGLSFTVHFVHSGATIVIPPAWDAAAMLDLIETESVNHFFAVPTMLADLAANERFLSDRLGSVRWIMSGAAPLPSALVDRFADVGIPVLQSYGATETCGPALCVDARHVQAKRDCVGLPFFHTQVRLEAGDGEEPVIGEPGEILVRAGHVFSGYWHNADATRAAFRDGWFCTGDVGRRDADGYFYLVDRKNDMIISGGENVYPLEVERVLRDHPDIVDAAIVGIADEKWGQIVCAVVVPSAGSDVTLATIASHCEPHLARYKIPRRLVLREILPRNATGKVQRPALLESIGDE